MREKQISQSRDTGPKATGSGSKVPRHTRLPWTDGRKMHACMLRVQAQTDNYPDRHDGVHDARTEPCPRPASVGTAAFLPIAETDGRPKDFGQKRQRSRTHFSRPRDRSGGRQTNNKIVVIDVVTSGPREGTENM